MPQRVIRTEEDWQSCARLAVTYKKPFTVSITPGAPRSNAQNRLQRKWMQEGAEQLEDQTADEHRAYCKLTFGVPILRAENEEFNDKYEETFLPLPYHIRLKLMGEPFDFAVTRLMTTKQKHRYLEEVESHFKALGVVLAQPDWRR